MKGGGPRVSIVTPCRNHGRYVREMLESVFAQTFSSWESIIVDDGSTDDTGEILDGIRHGKVRVIRTANRGPSAARNTGIAAARAPLILNLDADDKIAPACLERAVEIFENRPDAGIVYSGQRFFGAGTGRYELPPYSPETMLRDNVIPSLAFFRKDDWERVGGYSGDLAYGLEDYDFWLSLIELGREVYKIPEDLSFYRTYGRLGDCRSGRMKRSRRKATLSVLAVFRRHRKLYEKYPGEYDRMEKLERLWNEEPFVLRWLRELHHYWTLCRDRRTLL